MIVKAKIAKKEMGSRKIGSHLFFDRTIVELPFFNIKKTSENYN